MIAGYGHDDKACTFSILRSILDTEDQLYTACAVFTDKEEVGNIGATGAESLFFENLVLELLNKNGIYNLLDLRKMLQKSYMLSCDTSAALDPTYYVNDLL